MGIRQIVTAPNPVLREKAKRVKSITPELQRLIDDMVETMRLAPGVGLAAPQVGVSQRVIVVEVAEGSEEGDGELSETEAAGGPAAGPAAPRPTKLYALVNPEITRHSGELEPGTEGCLSIPGYLGEVERFSWATVKAQDRHGKPFKLKVRGWPARVFQHEIDHLDGVLFIDRAKRLWKVEPEEEQATPAV
jgi:peptide deformylase